MATVTGEFEYIQEARTQLAEALIEKFGVQRKDILNAAGAVTTAGLYDSNNTLKRLHDWTTLVDATDTSRIYVTQHTTNDVNYPIVWSNQNNTSTVKANLLYKSYSDLCYNPKNKKLIVGGSIQAPNYSGNWEGHSVSYFAKADHNHDGRYVRYFAVTSLDCNSLNNGFTAAKVAASNAASANHSAFLYVSDVGTPFQLQFPDSGNYYIYKRYKSGSSWSNWVKLYAGYADTAGSANSAAKVNNSLTILTNGTALGSYDGSAAKSWNITYGNVGAAAASHNHTSLNGVTRINFKADPSDSCYIGTTVSGSSTTLDFYLSDDAALESFRWIFNDCNSAVGLKTIMQLTPTNNANTALKLYGSYVATQSWASGLYVTSLGIDGRLLTWTKNGTTNKITIPFATYSTALKSTGDDGNWYNWVYWNGSYFWLKAGTQIYNNSTATLKTAVDYSTVSSYLLDNGVHGETASGTTANAANAGMLYGSGMYMTRVYNSSGAPTSFGNMLNLAGGGSSLLLLGWSGSDSTTASIYYRSHRDLSTGGWGSWRRLFFADELPSSIKNPNAIVFRNVNGTTVSYDGSAKVDLSAGTYIAKLPYGFSSWASGVGWGNTTGTSFASWNDSTGGSIDFRRDNPSSGKMSIKVDGRVYVNEGYNPVLSSEHNNGFWGMRTPDGGNDWIRTPNNGLIPYVSGGVGNGHSSLGTSGWYFSSAYIDNIYGSLKGNADTATSSKYLSGISLTGGNGNNEGYRLIFQKTMGGWTINYGVWAIAFRHSGRGVLNIGFDTTNSDGSTYTYNIRFFGSAASKESTPFRAFYNTTTKIFRIYWHYYDYTGGVIALLRGNIEPSNGTWITSLPSDVGTELTILYNDSDTLDGIHANGLLTALTNTNKGISITVGGTTKSIANISVNLATNADTLDNVHLNGIFTVFGNNGNNIKATIGGVSKEFTVNYAVNADKIDGYHAGISLKPFGTIPVIGSNGVIELGHYIDFHYDNTSNTDYSTRLQTQGNRSNVVNLPTASGTLALLTDTVSYASKLNPGRKLWGNFFDGSKDISGLITLASGYHVGIKLADTYLDAIDQSLIIHNNSGGIRFGNDAWDWNQWAGLMYNHSSKTIYLGIADGSVFVASSAQTNGTLNLKAGISTIEAPNIKFGNVTSGLCQGLEWTCGDNDFARIKAGATSSNAGYLEIATADDGNEPIYVRLYTGVFSSVVRTLTLLDPTGASIFPHYVSIGGNENNNTSPDRVWGSNSSDSFLRSYRTSALNVGYLGGKPETYFAYSELYSADKGYDLYARLPRSGFYLKVPEAAGGNTPFTGWTHLINCLHSNTSNNYALQIAASYFDNNTFKIRSNINSVYTDWHTLIHSDNWNSYIPLYSVFVQSSTNTWQNLGWNGSGNWQMHIIRSDALYPDSIAGAYSSAIMFGGSDTRGILSMRYDTPVIKFSGGNWGNAHPIWTIGLTGAAGTTYDLNRINKFAVAGMIMIWSGTTTNIPTGWVLCNGNNGTPNLSNRFVLGYGTKGVNNTGGLETVTLALYLMPKHSHWYSHRHLTLSDRANCTGFGSGVISRYECGGDDGGEGDGNDYYPHTITTSDPINPNLGYTYWTDSAGSGGSHNNMPPYYVLCYIMFVG